MLTDQLAAEAPADPGPARITMSRRDDHGATDWTAVTVEGDRSEVVVGGKRVPLLAWLLLDVSPTGAPWRRRPLTENGLADAAESLGFAREPSIELQRLREGLAGAKAQGALSGGLSEPIGPYARGGQIVFERPLDVDLVRLSEALRDGSAPVGTAHILAEVADAPWVVAVLRSSDVLVDGLEVRHFVQCCVASLLVARWSARMSLGREGDALPRGLLDELVGELPRWPPFEDGPAPARLRQDLADLLVGVADRVLAGRRSAFSERSLEALATVLDRARQLRGRDGARAFVPSDFERLSKRVERLQEFHARTLERTVRGLLAATITEADADESHLPAGRSRREMLQPIWVRRAAGARAGEAKDAPFRWDPLESPWPQVTVRGLPGYGKSWLLRHHAASWAEDALQRLSENQPVASLRIPVLLRCAQFGEQLPDRPSPADALEAIVAALAMSHQVDTDIDAVLAEAHDRGHLTICLDGLDEVPAADFEKVRAGIAALTAGRNRVLVSTRPMPQALASVVNTPGGVIFDLLGFSAQQATDVARVWFEHDQTRFGAFGRVLSEPAFAPLVRVPLLTSYLCRVVANLEPGARLPTSRPDLYRSVLRRMLSGGLTSSQGRTFVDPSSPPDADTRLRVLGAAVHHLSSAWRSTDERIDRAALRRAYAEADAEDLRVVQAGATRRWRAWSRARDETSHEAPDDLITWELIWDGLLVDEADGGPAPQVRFAHPTLREFVVATHVATLAPDERAQVIAEHRWFDRGWQPIIAMATALSSDPDRVLAALLDADDDPWHEQRLLAGRCLAACAPGQVSEARRAEVVSGVDDATRSPSVFDRDRGLIVLSLLIRADVPEARLLASTLTADETLPQSERWRLTCELAAVGDHVGIEHVLALVVDAALPLSIRAQAVAALARVADDEGRAPVTAAIASAEFDREARALVEATRPDQPWAAGILRAVLENPRAKRAARVACGRALVGTGPHGRDAVLVVVNDRMAARNLAAPLVSALLDDGDLRAIDAGLRLLDNPNVIDEYRDALVGSLTRRGVAEALREAEQLLTILSGDALDRLARNVARAGAPGGALLAALVNDRAAWDGGRLAAAAALLDSPEAQVEDLALADAAVREMQESPETPDELLVRAFVTSRAAGPLEMSAAQAERLVASCGSLEAGARCLGLVGQTEHADLAIERLAADEAETWEIPWREFVTGVERGRGFVERVIGCPEIAEPVRYRALGALAEVDPTAATAVWQRSRDNFDAAASARITVMLAGFGAVPMLPAAIDQLSASLRAYEALHALLTFGSGLTREQLGTALRAAAASPAPSGRAAPDSAVRITLEDLREAGHEPASQAEAVLQVRWCNNEIVRRISLWFFRTMLPSQVEEYERAAEDGPEVAEVWLARYFPEQHEVTAAARRDVLEEVAANPSVLPRANEAGPKDPYETAAFYVGVLQEWQSGETWESRADFLRRSPWLAHPQVRSAMLFISNLGGSFPQCDAHLFVLDQAIARDVDWAASLLDGSASTHDEVKLALDDRRGLDVFGGGALAVSHNKSWATGWFYAALGAQMCGWSSFAEHLMARSGERAHETQVTDGCETIGDVGARNEWPEEVVARLRAALMTGKTTQERADGQG